MTREEAIDVLKHNYPSSCYEDLCKAVDMAIKALEQPEPCEDTISRQMAIDAVSRGCQEFRGIFAECEKNLNELPSAQSEPSQVARDIATIIENEQDMRVMLRGDERMNNTKQSEQKKGKWVEKFDRIIRELGVYCAYDMPSFWCNQGTDYKVIPTKYHKGYMQALADVEERMKGAEE